MNAAGFVMLAALIAVNITPTPPVPPERLAVLLAQQVAEPAPTTRARGPYFQSTITLTVTGGPVLLASSADGIGNLRTDDAATLTILRPDGSARVWTHDFRDVKNGAIITVGPQDLSALFLRGLHTVTLTLNDALPPVFSSGAYFLIVNAVAVATPTATASPGSTAISAIPVSPTPTPAELALPSGPHPTSAPSNVESPDNLRNDTGPGPALTDPPTASEPAATPFPAGLLVLIACPALVVAFWASRRARKDGQLVLTGFVHLTDLQTGERLSNVDLTAFGAEAGVTLNPLAIAQPSKNSHPIAIFAATPNGVVIRTAAVAGEPLTQTLLSDAKEFELEHRLRLEYRCPLASLWMSNILDREPGALKSARGH